MRRHPLESARAMHCLKLWSIDPAIKRAGIHRHPRESARALDWLKPRSFDPALTSATMHRHYHSAKALSDSNEGLPRLVEREMRRHPLESARALHCLKLWSIDLALERAGMHRHLREFARALGWLKPRSFDPALTSATMHRHYHFRTGTLRRKRRFLTPC